MVHCVYVLISCSKRNSVQTCICNSFLMTTTLSPTTVSAKCNNTGNSQLFSTVLCSAFNTTSNPIVPFTDTQHAVIVTYETYMVYHMLHRETTLSAILSHHMKLAQCYTAFQLLQDAITYTHNHKSVSKKIYYHKNSNIICTIITKKRCPVAGVRIIHVN